MSLHFNLEFLGAATAYFCAATAYAAEPQLILRCKPIIISNPTEVKQGYSVEIGAELGL